MTQIMEVGYVICVTNFHDLCSWQSPRLGRKLCRSRHNRIWA